MGLVGQRETGPPTHDCGGCTGELPNTPFQPPAAVTDISAKAVAVIATWSLVARPLLNARDVGQHGRTRWSTKGDGGGRPA